MEVVAVSVQVVFVIVIALIFFAVKSNINILRLHEYQLSKPILQNKQKGCIFENVFGSVELSL